LLKTCLRCEIFVLFPSNISKIPC